MNYNGVEYDIDEEYSYKDFTGHSLKHKPMFNGIVIMGSCFSQEIPDTEVFPPDLQNVTLIKCNLDNVKVPQSFTVIDCSQKRFQLQNDLRDWEIDSEGNPVQVMGKKYWEMNGYSVDPNDIPDQPLQKIDDIVRIG